MLLTVLLVSTGKSYADVLNSQIPIKPSHMVKIMGSGVDVTWSEVNSKIAVYSTQASKDFADKGFKHFRLRVANDDVATITGFLDQQVQDALDHGVIPIIANQSHSFEDNPTLETQAAWIKWWKDIAEHYKDYPYEVMFDLIVEIAASSALSDEPIEQLNEAYEQAVTAIRNTGGFNEKRIIIFSAHKRSDPTKMMQLDIPTQGNGYLIGEFHEGYASGPSIDPTNPHYYWNGTAEEIKLMSERADAAVEWSTFTGIPIWEGAWMPGNYNKGNNYDIARQIKFVEDFVNVLNDRKIPHAVNATKKFYDVTTNEWNELEEVVDAIMALRLDENTEVLNEVPVWTNTVFSLPNAEQNQNYTYDISSDISDAENDIVTFTKDAGPGWLTVSEQGVIRGTPSNVDTGENNIVIRATDGESNSAKFTSAIFTINVSPLIADVEPINTAPIFSSPQIVKAVVTEGSNIFATLKNDANDSESTELIFNKVDGPSWLFVGADGMLSGTPNPLDIGINNFTVEVTDEGGLTGRAMLQIEVKAKEPDKTVKSDESSEPRSGGSFGMAILCLLFPFYRRLKFVFR